MYVVTVRFTIAGDHASAFAEAVEAQARTTLEKEPQCRMFEVCQDPDAPEAFFLYELYLDAEAFRRHLETEHFRAFDEKVAPWVETKSVKTFERLWP